MAPFLGYLRARWDEYERDFLYKVYISDALQYAGQNKYPAQRFVDLLKPKDNRTGDEVAADVISRLGLSFNE